MDFWIVEYWSFAFTVILSFLGGLTYFIQRQISIDKSQFNIMNQQGRPGSTNTRRKTARNLMKKKQQTLSNTNVDSNATNGEEDKKVVSEVNTEKCYQEENSILDHSIQQSDEYPNHEESQNSNEIEQVIPASPSTNIDDIQEPMIPVKQRYKTKSMNKPSSINSSKDYSTVSSKPQASVAPVKQPYGSSSNKSSSTYSNSSQDTSSKSNGYMPPSRHMYTYSPNNPLPPRFQQQKLQKDAASAARRFRKRRGPLQQKRSSLSPDSAARPNDFIPSSVREHEQQQQQQQQSFADYNQIESSNDLSQQYELSMNNGYSSESDILTDSPSTGGNNSISPLLSTSAGSQSSLQRLELVRSLATSYGLLDELVSIFDTIAFSSDELQIILNKIASKHLPDRQDLQRLIASTKTDKSFERILEETYRSQAKILAIELQAEKNRVLELTKSNADMENTIRQMQQQQQQQPNNMIQYEQMLVTHQIQLRRFAEENSRLQHQLHAYSLMPATINELKQRENILNEQIRQMTIRTSALENEAAETERASKHAAEIYKKADTQKQERIEQMIADINKYKKLDKELTNLRQKHSDLEKSFNSKIEEVAHQRDELLTHCDKLKQQLQEYEQLQPKYEKLIHSQSKNPTNQIKQEINDLKAKNDELRQRNWKIMEELNKLLRDQQQNQSIESS